MLRPKGLGEKAVSEGRLNLFWSSKFFPRFLMQSDFPFFRKIIRFVPVVSN